MASSRLFGGGRRDGRGDIYFVRDGSSRCGRRRSCERGELAAGAGEARPRRLGAVFGLLGGDPGIEALRLDHLDRDRHEAMLGAAELRALTIVDADTVGLEPGLV